MQTGCERRAKRPTCIGCSICVERERSTAQDDAAGDPPHACGSMVRTGAGICLNLELRAKGTSCLATEEEELHKLFQMTSAQLANYLVKAG